MQDKPQEELSQNVLSDLIYLNAVDFYQAIDSSLLEPLKQQNAVQRLLGYLQLQHNYEKASRLLTRLRDL